MMSSARLTKAASSLGKGTPARLLTGSLAHLAARWYLKKPWLTEKIQERYQNPATVCAAALNLLFFHAHSTRSYRITGICLEPINLCNLHCTICPYDREMAREKGHIKLDLVKKIITENPRVESYTIPFLGEPFLHTGLPEIIGLIKYAGKKVHLYTNGTIIKDNVLMDIFKSGLDTLNFSLEGIEQSYTDIRGFPYQQIEANIIKSLELRNTLKASTKIKIHSVVSKDTMNNMKELLQRWNGVVDSLKFSSYQYGVPNNGQKGGCRELWRGALIILWDGRVVPCCFDVNASLCIGNAYDESLEQLWNGPTMRGLRKKILSEPRQGICSQCASYVFNFPPCS